MRSKGNGTPAVCVDNLLKIVRREVPFERVKGLDPRLVDRPLVEAEAELQQDAEWLISTYEPRVTVGEIQVAQANGVTGNFTVTAEVKEREV